MKNKCPFRLEIFDLEILSNFIFFFPFPFLKFMLTWICWVGIGRYGSDVSSKMKHTFSVQLPFSTQYSLEFFFWLKILKQNFGLINNRNGVSKGRFYFLFIWMYYQWTTLLSFLLLLNTRLSSSWRKLFSVSAFFLYFQC